MKEKLLLQVELDPIRILYGTKNKTRIMALNQVISMNPHKLNCIHADFLKSYREIIAESFLKHPWGHKKEQTYNVSIGFKSGAARLNDGSKGRKTPRLDLDGLAWIEKVAIDALVKETSIPDDSFRYITEVRTKYLGESEFEHLYLQVTTEIPDEIVLELT